MQDKQTKTAHLPRSKLAKKPVYSLRRSQLVSTKRFMQRESTDVMQKTPPDAHLII